MSKLTLQTFDAEVAKAQKKDKNYVRVGLSTCGVAAGGEPVYAKIKELAQKKGLKVFVERAGCLGMCYAEPLVEVNVDGAPRTIYSWVDEALAERIVEEHLIGKKVIEGKTVTEGPKQVKIVLRNTGVVDPDNIDDYLSVGGYAGLKRMLSGMSQDDVIAQMKTSGLRGRGGAGFPTWMKWDFAKKTAGDEKYMVCNGDEGDPGAYMDRSVLEGDPHSVVEGMIVAGYAIGAKMGYFYIRAEYPLAIKRVRKAIEDARARGLLGANILGTGFSYDLDIRLGAGAFVCGEETALLASIEGKRGTPRPRPPFPAVKGLWDKPTVINNVETLANVSAIIAKGGAWYAGYGTEKSKGTKVFALTGKVKNTGLIEVPMGITLREIVYEIGGGMLFDKYQIKAVQTGGPSGGVIPKDYLDTAVDYDSLAKLGSIMGSGGMIVMDESDCMVDIAKFYLGFCVDESCGKCSPCRIGGCQMLEILTRISDGKGKSDDIAKLKSIGLAMKKASLCGLGQTAANPVLSTINYFLDEYEEHIGKKHCRAAKCVAMLNYAILAKPCKRCGLCVKACPVNAISGDRNAGYTIDQSKCVKCGACFEACPFRAITKG
jgi:NADH:ubiquinone oxidoreductase subunit F (NADH-binding)/NAD-dependent dihydropyrimidine dehydrogenase PreA subunit